ncbi:cytochrome c biogenesis protein ResB [Naumannella halotolerans]|uniref:Cytochrome c biogenesis protein n=1 Tax=Naumannella halotolerans TaxID=993414 RepID=A0A4R7J0T8_9ACTN|nr:cytochrome c biogenesis protein ResB [Naumannella halotolerans]TDT29996.1 cytochrome c biogenesis protein [Naumannella halotolerans]
MAKDDLLTEGPSADEVGNDTAADRVAQERRKDSSTGFGLTDWLRWLWNQLTAMRTALALLFLGALAAIPGSFVPQRSISPFEVEQFIADNPTLGSFYDAIGMFSVYTSPWFAAIYLLLLISLVGCIVPRIGQHYKAVKAEPPRAPKRLSRLPENAETRVGSDPEEVLDTAAAFLRRKRFRVVRRDGELSAEKGYLREVGNLTFHICLVLILATIAVSVLWGFRGTSATIVGRGFSNNLAFYDDVTAGGLFRTDQLSPFTLQVDDFTVEYNLGDPQNASQPLHFETNVTVIDRPGAQPRSETITVNHPITIDGVQVHLLGYGFAPVVTVTDGEGQVAYSGPVLFLPQDGNFTSAGVIKAPDARPEQVAFQGFFLPTATVDEMGPRSVFPDAYVPELFLNAWAGEPTAETGVPENVYQLDTTGLEQLTSADGEPLRIRLAPGESYQLPDGQGTLSFDGYTRWVRLQYSSSPGAAETLVAIGLAVAGLCLSLFVRPRRIWVKAGTGEAPPGRTPKPDPVPTEASESAAMGAAGEAAGNATADAGSTQVDPADTEPAESASVAPSGPTWVEVGGLDRVGGRIGLEDELAAVLGVVQDADIDRSRGDHTPGDESRGKEPA